MLARAPANSAPVGSAGDVCSGSGSQSESRGTSVLHDVSQLKPPRFSVQSSYPSSSVSCIFLGMIPAASSASCIPPCSARAP
eukprot:1705280-Pyramimonas_sp.AAC.1